MARLVTNEIKKCIRFKSNVFQRVNQTDIILCMGLCKVKKKIPKIQNKLQEKALRYYMLDFKSSYKQLLHNCGNSTLFLQRLQKLMEVIYRILNGLYPSYLNDIITIGELHVLVQCVMERKVYHIYHPSHGTH